MHLQLARPVKLKLCSGAQKNPGRVLQDLYEKNLQQDIPWQLPPKGDHIKGFHGSMVHTPDQLT